MRDGARTERRRNGSPFVASRVERPQRPSGRLAIHWLVRPSLRGSGREGVIPGWPLRPGSGYTPGSP